MNMKIVGGAVVVILVVRSRGRSRIDLVFFVVLNADSENGKQIFEIQKIPKICLPRPYLHTNLLQKRLTQKIGTPFRNFTILCFRFIFYDFLLRSFSYYFVWKVWRMPFKKYFYQIR